MYIYIQNAIWINAMKKTVVKEVIIQRNNH